MAQRYRCVDCKTVKAGSPRVLWCDGCGGELKPLKYAPRKRKVARDR